MRSRIASSLVAAIGAVALFFGATFQASALDIEGAKVTRSHHNGGPSIVAVDESEVRHHSKRLLVWGEDACDRGRHTRAQVKVCGDRVRAHCWSWRGNFLCSARLPRDLSHSDATCQLEVSQWCRGGRSSSSIYQNADKEWPLVLEGRSKYGNYLAEATDNTEESTNVDQPASVPGDAEDLGDTDADDSLVYDYEETAPED